MRGKSWKKVADEEARAVHDAYHDEDWDDFRDTVMRGK